MQEQNQLIKNIIEYLKNNLSFDRYNHSLSVSVSSVDLATFYNENILNAKIAGLLHDMAKEINFDMQIEKLNNYNYILSDDDKNNPKVLHGILGAYMSKEIFNINDDIFNAIYTHTLGDNNMTNLQKIVFIADFIEPLRDEIEDINSFRKLAYESLDKCVYEISKRTINHLKSKNVPIHHKTLETYEFYKMSLT